MPLAPEIWSFGDGTHAKGDTDLSINGAGFRAFPGRAFITENADGSGASCDCIIQSWNDLDIVVTIPTACAVPVGIAYLFVETEALARSLPFLFTLLAPPALAIDLDPGSYSIDGAEVGLAKDYRLAAEAGAYGITGFDVDLLYGRIYTLEADAGAYAIAGDDLGLVKAWRVDLDPGAYAVDGADLDLIYGRSYDLDIEAGNYGIIGSDSDLLFNRRLDVLQGSYGITGASVDLIYVGITVEPDSIGLQWTADINRLEWTADINRLEWTAPTDK